MFIFFVFFCIDVSNVGNVILCLSNIKKYIVICLLGKLLWEWLLLEFKFFKGVFNYLMYEIYVCN